MEKIASNNEIKKVLTENKNTYDKLADTSNDEYKFMGIFGENKTTGLNGEIIVFDKMYINEETGTILYYKDEKNIKNVSTTHVVIVDGDNEFVYYKDGSLEVKNKVTEVTTYYDSDGIKVLEVIDLNGNIIHDFGNGINFNNKFFIFSIYKNYENNQIIN